jgi:hypothetical protein
MPRPSAAGNAIAHEICCTELCKGAVNTQTPLGLTRKGVIMPAILLWLLGVPIPIIILLVLLL